MACRRQLVIETVNSNIRLFEEFLDNFEVNGATAEDLDLCKKMATNCDKLHPNLSRLATETDEKDEGSIGLDDFGGDCPPVNLLQPLKAEKTLMVRK